MGNKDRRVTRIWKAIDEVLWHDWDPIGVNGTLQARDEYNGYIGGVFQLLEHRCGEEELLTYLHDIETNQMGLAGDRDHCRVVAKELLQINIDRLTGE